MNANDIRTVKRLTDIKAAITARAMTSSQLAEVIHINRASTNKYIRDLLGDRIYIESWICASFHITATYRWGKGENAPKPSASTKKQYEKKRIERIRKNPEMHDRYLSYHRARTATNRAKSKPNTWASSLFAGVRLPLNAEG